MGVVPACLCTTCRPGASEAKEGVKPSGAGVTDGYHCHMGAESCKPGSYVRAANALNY